MITEKSDHSATFTRRALYYQIHWPIGDVFEEECDLLSEGVMLAPLEGQSISDQNIKECTSAKLFSDLDRQMILADITSEPKSISSVQKQIMSILQLFTIGQNNSVKSYQFTNQKGILFRNAILVKPLLQHWQK